MHDRELAVLEQPFEADHAAAETEMIVDRQQFLLRDPDRRPMPVIGVVAVGHERVEPVVAAGKLEHDENPAVGFGLGRESGSRLREERRCAQGGADAKPAQSCPEDGPAVGRR